MKHQICFKFKNEPLLLKKAFKFFNMKMAIVSLQYTEDIAAINYQSPPPNSLIQTSFEYKPIVYRLDLDETRQNIRF